MSQKDTKRISHELTSLPNFFRDDGLEQILNDIDEELTGNGYLEVARVSPTEIFIQTITVWDSAAKSKKRYEVTFDRSASPPFINQITQSIYSENGQSVVSTVTTTIARDADKKVTNITTATVRA